MKLTYGSAPLTPLEILQLGLTLLCLVLAFALPRLGNRWFSRVEQSLRAIARRRWLCAVLAGLFPIGLRLLLVPSYSAPSPFIHDEFAYLLQADTFASGRVTNPAPPLPQFFASVYILVDPTYSAEYQPAQGLTLAAGQKLTGSPWAAVVACMGVFCALLYWALLPWLPSTWALAGAGLTGIEIGVFSYWMNGYWGGSVAAIGGALLLGALPRMSKEQRPRHAFIAALGLIIMINSRPLEGALLSLITAAVLLYWFFVTRQLSWAALLRRILAPMTLVFGVALVCMGYYNERVTGHVTQFPYLLYRHRYGIPQGFLWQKKISVTTPMPVDIKSTYEVQLRTRERANTMSGIVLLTAKKIRRFWEFYVGVPLTLTLVFLPFIWRGPHMNLALLGLIAVVGLDNMTFFEYYPHYSAPVAALIVLAIVQCIRRMRASGQAGLFLSRSLPIVCLIALLVPMCGRYLEPYVALQTARLWHSEFTDPTPRAKFLKWLNKQPGQQLVMVRYASLPEESTNEAVLELKRLRDDTGWIYNTANLRAARVVWARELDPESNRQLVQSFPDRKVWLLEPEQRPMRLRSYSMVLSQSNRAPH
jgi:hypothetical protein